MQAWLGVDIGGTQVKTALVRADGQTLASSIVDTHSERGPADLATRLAAIRDSLCRQAQVAPAQLAGVGVGVPAFLNPQGDMLLEAPNLHWRNVPLAAQLRAALQLPVTVENDANVAALGEAWLGAGTGAACALCATVGTGVGGGIVIAGRLHRGVGGMAGEIGHMRVDRQAPLPCNCGLTGCLETRASATAIVRAAVALQTDGQLPAEPKICGAADVYRLAAQGETAARDVVDSAAWWLGLGLSMAATVLNPDVIIIGGGVAAAGDDLLVPTRQSFLANSIGRVASCATLRLARLGNEAGVVGAARLAMHRLEQGDTP